MAPRPTNSAAEVVRGLYAAFARGDVIAVLGSFAENIVWNEAENFIYADGNPYVGPQAILNGIFMRLPTEWEGFTVTPSEFVAEGDRVAVTGRYTGTHRATGKAINSQFAHFWTLSGGKVVAFQQYTDTLQAAQVAGSGA